ncbi:hypothetical protein H072_4512 [Dactylellina haptotyla CBS 200.50]|uniref:Zn(2)-C6 fungal-type domain-containing protein n=1 Tax=Dactylellina haptotyla (strain CBS 200.50) TaxID=1284197 RepID=S8C1V4_DACHA|nr:hypothetical protein H072_4512 [Dactylellina haptotyla CBS 200.50]
MTTNEAGSRYNSTATHQSHRKSRNGCVQCKQRHTKCDEFRPVCGNCSSTDRGCSFINGVAPPQSNTSSGSSTAPTISSSSAEHLETQVLKFGASESLPIQADASRWADILIKYAVSEPYLRDELLALSALHLSTLTSDTTERKRYQHQAAQLQTRALMVFNTTRPAVREENYMTMFLFSGFLGIHDLFDAASLYKDFIDFLDLFIQFLNLHRSIRAITSQSWHVIKETELLHIFHPIIDFETGFSHSEGTVNECSPLMALLEASSDEIVIATLNACRDAVQRIEWILRHRRSLQETLHLRVGMTWLVLIPSDFLQLLKKRRPEAPVILAHWAVFLHYHRDFWVSGDSGRILIESTSQ